MLGSVIIDQHTQRLDPLSEGFCLFNELSETLLLRRERRRKDRQGRGEIRLVCFGGMVSCRSNKTL
jgi:hypothetical protein